MEFENKFASKGVAGAGLGLGIAGTALGVLNGGLGNILGNGWGNTPYNMMNSDSMPVNRYEATQSARIAELETEVKLRDANIYTDGKLNDLRNYMERKFDHVEHELCDQRVYNATNTAAVSCLGQQVNGIQNVLGVITKTVIPKSAICPEVMPRYNSWTAPTAEAADTTTP